MGRFFRRVKRFSIEFEHAGGRAWAHTNNSGAMLGLLRYGAPALFSKSANPGRKLPYTLERIWIGGQNGFWAGVNTMLVNRLFEAAFYAGLLPFCAGYTSLRREAKREESRFDLCLEGPGLPRFWIECKNVTLVEDGVAAFPDAPSERAQKHMRELTRAARAGERAAMLYLVQRADGQCFSPADYIDPVYAELFYEGMANGVEMLPWRAVFSDAGTGLGERLPVK